VRNSYEDVYSDRNTLERHLQYRLLELLFDLQNVHTIFIYNLFVDLS